MLPIIVWCHIYVNTNAPIENQAAFCAITISGEVVNHRSPQEIMDEMAALDAESAEVLENIRALL